MTIPTPARRAALAARASEIASRLLGEMKLARKRAGYTQDRLAREVGVAKKAIGSLENGSGTLETFIVVAETLKFHFAEIGPGDTLLEQITRRRETRFGSIEAAAAKTGLEATVIEALEGGRGSTSDLFRLLAGIAPRVRRRKPERSHWGQGEKVDRDSRFTPVEFLESIYDAFGEVSLDPCAHPASPVVAGRRIIPAEGGDGLTDDWSGRLAFVNPPYSKQLDWLKRAHGQWMAGHVEIVVCLAPVRTDNGFFHDTLHADADLFLLKGRLRFSRLGGDPQHTPYSLWLVVLGASAEQRARLEQLVAGRWFRASS